MTKDSKSAERDKSRRPHEMLTILLVFPSLTESTFNSQGYSKHLGRIHRLGQRKLS